MIRMLSKTSKSLELCMWFGAAVAALLVSFPAVPAQESSSPGNLFDRQKLGRYVKFSGISEPVKVAFLEWAAGRNAKKKDYALPADIVRKIIRARDRNALWLISQRRDDYTSVSYTYEFTSRSGKTYTYPYVGRYDRGIPLLLPSEFILYYGDVTAYEYEDGPDYFKVIIKPHNSEPNHGIPDYIYWARPLWKPFGWMNAEEVTRFLRERSEPQYHYGYELWFTQKDMRLVKERVTAPARTGKGSSPGDHDFDEPVVVTEVNYAYAGDENYPVDVSIRNVGTEGDQAEFLLHFQMVNGFWMLRSGTLEAVLGGSRLESAYSAKNITVQR